MEQDFTFYENKYSTISSSSSRTSKAGSFNAYSTLPSGFSSTSTGTGTGTIQSGFTNYSTLPAGATFNSHQSKKYNNYDLNSQGAVVTGFNSFGAENAVVYNNYAPTDGPAYNHSDTQEIKVFSETMSPFDPTLKMPDPMRKYEIARAKETGIEKSKKRC